MIVRAVANNVVKFMLMILRMITTVLYDTCDAFNALNPLKSLFKPVCNFVIGAHLLDTVDSLTDNLRRKILEHPESIDGGQTEDHSDHEIHLPEMHGNDNLVTTEPTPDILPTTICSSWWGC